MVNFAVMHSIIKSILFSVNFAEVNHCKKCVRVIKLLLFQIVSQSIIAQADLAK